MSEECVALLAAAAVARTVALDRTSIVGLLKGCHNLVMGSAGTTVVATANGMVTVAMVRYFGRRVERRG